MTEETLELVLKNINNLHSILIVVCILVILDIVSILGKIIVEINLGKRKEIHVNRKTEITKKQLQIEEELYGKLEHLTLFDNQGCYAYITEIQVVERYISMNKLYITKPIAKKAFQLLDYSKIIAMDFTKKDITIEQGLLNEYIGFFNK